MESVRSLVVLVVTMSSPERMFVNVDERNSSGFVVSRDEVPMFTHEHSLPWGRIGIAATSNITDAPRTIQARHKPPTYIFGYAQRPLIKSADGDIWACNGSSSRAREDEFNLQGCSVQTANDIGNESSKQNSSRGEDTSGGPSSVSNNPQLQLGDATEPSENGHFNNPFACPNAVHNPLALDYFSTVDGLPAIADSSIEIEHFTNIPDILNPQALFSVDDPFDMFNYEGLDLNAFLPGGAPNPYAETASTAVCADKEVFQQWKGSAATSSTRPRCKRIRQSHIVTKRWWNTNIQTWTPRDDGGIYVDGILINVKQEAASEDITQQKQSEHKRPSRFCHICLRRAERVTAVACARLTTARCRKVVCKRCFDEHGWDWRAAITKRSGWTCSHCQHMYVFRKQYRSLQYILSLRQTVAVANKLTK